MDDFDLDNSDRIGQRVSHGVYRVTHNRKDVGEELWGIFGLRDGGYRIMTEIDLRWPVPNQQRARIDLDADWHPVALFIQLDAQGKRHRAHYLLTEDRTGAEVNVFEENLRYTDTGKSANEQSISLTQATKPKRMFGDTLPFDANTFFDFGSTLLNFVHFRRLNLRLNTKATRRMIVVAQPTLEPMTLTQTFAYVRDEVISTQLQPAIPTHRYTIEEQTESGEAPISTLWADHHDVVLKQDVLLGKDTHGCELVSYTWQGN
jgi:hypothetical protein